MIKIIADSTFGIKESYALEKDIQIVKLKMNLENVVYEEGFEEYYRTYLCDFNALLIGGGCRR